MMVYFLMTFKKKKLIGGLVFQLSVFVTNHLNLKMKNVQFTHSHTLSAYRSLAFEEFLQKPNQSFTLSRDTCLATEVKLLELDIHTVKVTELEEITRAFEFRITRSGVLHGFCSWFQADFQGLAPDIGTRSLNTGPDHE